MKKNILIILAFLLPAVLIGGLTIAARKGVLPNLSGLSTVPETSGKDISEEISQPLAAEPTVQSSESEPLTSEESKEETVDKDSWELVLVNKDHKLTEEYQVELDDIDGFKFDARASGALKNMIAAANEDGIQLVLISTYRPFERSRLNFNNKVQELMNAGYSETDATTEAARWIAPPGESEHNTGLAMDIVSKDYYDVYGAYLDTPFEDFDGFQWLIEHCADYGFILRYPADKESVTGIHYEPWHYRYVGVENAKKIMESGISLEEYLA